MDNNLDNIDKIFAKSLGNHSIDPPASVWDNIKSELDASAGQHIDQTFAAALGAFSIEPSTSVWDKIQEQLDASASSHNIDNVFEKGLGQHTMEPPSYVWNNIKGSLDLALGKRRRIIGWFFGTASAVVIAFIGGYFIANSGASSSENTISEKITNLHRVQIDINHFWNLRNIPTLGETNSGGHSYTNNTPNSNDNTITGNSNSNNNGNTNNGFDNKNNNTNTNGYFDTHSKEDFQDNRNTPNIIINNDQHNPGAPAKNQDNGGENDGKKTNAVTCDVNGPVESQIGTKGSTIVTAVDNNNLVVIENSTNNVIVSDNNSNTNNTVEVNTTVEENRTEIVNPNDKSTFQSKQDEKGDDILGVKVENPTSFTILPFFSPTYTFRNSAMTSNNGIQDAFDSLNGNSKFSEKVNFSFSTGLLVGYNFTKNLTVFIGASFNSFSNTTSRNNIHTKSFDQMAPSDSSTNMLTTAGELEGVNVIPGTAGSTEDPTKILQDNIVGTVNSVTQTFSYIEVPVMIRYKIGGPKIGLILTGGISTGFIVQNNVQLAGDNETKSFGQTSQIRNFNMNVSFGVGIEVKLLPFMYLNIEPTFKYSFINWSMDSRFQMNPISLGLNTGLAFKF